MSGKSRPKDYANCIAEITAMLTVAIQVKQVLIALRWYIDDESSYTVIAYFIDSLTKLCDQGTDAIDVLGSAMHTSQSQEAQ